MRGINSRLTTLRKPRIGWYPSSRSIVPLTPTARSTTPTSWKALRMPATLGSGPRCADRSRVSRHHDRSTELARHRYRDGADPGLPRSAGRTLRSTMDATTRTRRSRRDWIVDTSMFVLAVLFGLFEVSQRATSPVEPPWLFELDQVVGAAGCAAL